MKRIIVGFLVLLNIFCLIGCGSIYNDIPEPANEEQTSQQAQADQTATATDDPSVEVYYTVGMHIILPYWQDHRLGLEAAGEELGVKVVFTGENGNNALRQVDLAPRNRASYNVRKERKKTNKGAERKWQERTTRLNRSLSSCGR